MAYGKIKADTFVYDNSGSDVEITVSSLGNKANLNSPTFTGTPVVPGYAPLAGATFTGNVVMSANLTVQGTTTTISSTTIEVADKNLELGKVSTPTDTTADGGGITLKGASDKTFNWVDATDAWTSSEHIALGDNKKLLVGTGSDLEIYHNGSDSYIVNTVGNLTLKDDSQLIVRAPITAIKSADNSELCAKFIEDGAVELYHNHVKKLETTAAGVTVTGTVTDSKGDVRSIPVNSKTSAYTLVAADAGKCIPNTTGGWTINNNVFSAGDAVTLYNNSGSDQTITRGSGATMYHAADGDTSTTRTLGTRGMATIYFLNASEFTISGAGLS